jgi:DNA-binding NtrC family response regulator
LALLAAEEGKRIRLITPEALPLLTAFHWPGNVRQLENAVFRAVLPAPDPIHDDAATPLADDPHESRAAPSPFDDAPAIAPAASPAALVDALPLLDAAGDVRPLEEIETDLIRYAVTHYRGQMSEVARRLRIGRSTLYRKLDALGLNSGSREEEGVSAERQPRKIA